MRLRTQFLAVVAQLNVFAAFCCVPANADPAISAPLVDRAHLSLGYFRDSESAGFGAQTLRAAFDVNAAFGVDFAITNLYLHQIGFPMQSLTYRAGLRFHSDRVDFVGGASVDTVHTQPKFVFNPYFRVSTRYDYGWMGVAFLDGPEVPLPYEFARATLGLSGVNVGLPVDASVSSVIFHNRNAYPAYEYVADLDVAFGLNFMRLRGVVHYLPSTETLLFTLGVNDYSTQTNGDGKWGSGWLRPRAKAGKVAYATDKLGQHSDEEQRMPERHHDFFGLFVKGRQITWLLDGMASGKTSQTCLVVQRRDVRVENQISALIRLQCDDGIAEEETAKQNDALLVRTGCHILDNAGLWRLPRCPDAAGPVELQRRTLVVASEALFASIYARFFEFTSHRVEHRILKSNGNDVDAACFANPIAGVLNMCVSDDDGLLWAQGKDKSVARLSAIAMVEVPAEEDQRFSSASDSDLRCSLHSRCTAFGQCHSHSTPAPVEPQTAPGSDLPAEPTSATGKPAAMPDVAAAKAKEPAARAAYWKTKAQPSTKVQPTPDIITCVSLGDGDCRAAFICDHNGNCAAKAGACIAKSADDCRLSNKCRSDGQCQVVGESCSAIAGDTCRFAASCSDFGRCTFRGSSCVVADDADCRQQKNCSLEGLCGAFGNTCIAISDEHCAQSIGCAGGGRCKALGGVCVK